MHDEFEEFERAITGSRAHRGLSPLGWVFVTLGFFALAGTLGAGFVAYKVANEVRHEIRNVVTRELGAAPNVAVARMAARLASAEDLVSMRPERGLALISGVDGGDGPTEILRAMSAPLGTPDGAARPDPSTEEAQEVASLSVSSDKGRIAFDLARTDDGGLLTIDSDEGRVRVEFVDGDEGGRLRIHTDEGRVVAAFGGDAQRAPGWVERFGDVPTRAQPVVSVDSERGRLGAVAWESEDGASELLASYLQALEAEGYEVKVEHRVRNGSEEHGSLWARHEADERMVFVVAHREARGRTGVLVGYGEKR